MSLAISKAVRLLAISCTTLAVLASPLAHANVVVSHSGLTTTYTENFNGGTSFSAGWFDTLLSNDDYLWLTALTPSSSYSFTSATPLSNLSLSFWYSVPGSNSGQVQYANSATLSLGDTPGSALQFLINNPGQSTGGIGGAFDSQFMGSVSNLGAGQYTITLSTAGHLLDGLKVDDLVISTTSVPEPASLGLLGIGLLGFGAAAKRRRG